MINNNFFRGIAHYIGLEKSASKRRTYYEKTISENGMIKRGISQGSILGSLMYSVQYTYQILSTR